MSEIPADVLEAAKAAWWEAETKMLPTDAYLTIASAILAERERCAEIADSVGASAIKFMQERLNQHSNDFQRFSEGCTAVAVSIRRGDETTPSKARQTEEARS